MEFSARLTGINGSGGDDGWSVLYRARAMAAAGVPVVNLSVGEPDVGTDPDVLGAMHQAAVGGDTGYAPVPGIDALRSAVAQRVQATTGVPTGPANVLITAGGQAALFAAHMAACDPGDRALFVDPYYATYPGTIRAVSATPVPVRSRAEDGFQPRADALESVAAGARSVLINSPNNPTGVVYTRETMEGVADVARRHRLWVVSDEVYDSQIWRGSHLSPRALPEMEERTLVVGSMSKAHAMTGSRIGWVVGPDAAIAAVADLSTNTNYGVSGFIQQAALYALGQGAAGEARVAGPFRRRRDLVMELLERQNVVRAVPPDGAMYVMLDVRPSGLSGKEFAMRLLDRHRIAVMPGESFGEAAAGHVRVALTVDDQALASAITTLVGFVSEIQGLPAARGGRVAQP